MGRGVERADHVLRAGAFFRAAAGIARCRVGCADKPGFPLRIDLRRQRYSEGGELCRRATARIHEHGKFQAVRRDFLRRPGEGLPQAWRQPAGGVPGGVGILLGGIRRNDGGRLATVEGICGLEGAPLCAGRAELNVPPAGGAAQGQNTLEKLPAVEGRQRTFPDVAGARIKASREHQVPRAVLQLGEHFDDRRAGRGLVDVEHAEILGAAGMGVLREKLGSLRALKAAVFEFVFNERVRAADEADDALLLVDEPALDADLAILRPADELGFFECAEERRVGQRVERDGGALEDELVGQRGEVGGRVGASRLQEAVQMVGQEPWFVATAGGTATRHLDGRAPDLDPMVPGIEQLDAQGAGGGRGRDAEEEAGAGQSGLATMALLDLRARHAQNAEMRNAVDDGADIRKTGAGLRQEPAADPDGLALENPLAGLLHIKDIGGVFVHGWNAELRRRGGRGASTATHGSVAGCRPAGQRKVQRQRIRFVKTVHDRGARPLRPTGIAGEMRGERRLHGLGQLVAVAGRHQPSLVGREHLGNAVDIGADDREAKGG